MSDVVVTVENWPLKVNSAVCVGGGNGGGGRGRGIGETMAGVVVGVVVTGAVVGPGVTAGEAVETFRRMTSKTWSCRKAYSCVRK